MDITSETVGILVRTQFPQWADLPVTPVRDQGNDNRTFRLGDDLAVRLPSAAGYEAGVAKENRCLPLVRAHVNTAVPEPVATGTPGSGYPFAWSVRRWIRGTALDRDAEVDRRALAADLGNFLSELRSVPSDGGPPAGAHSFYRGAHPSVYGDQVQHALELLTGQVDDVACRAIWDVAVRTAWAADPVWFHGDVAPGNLLIERSQLVAVIDFGICGVGDPACDLAIAWTYFDEAERGILRDEAGFGDETWNRGRGWGLWKALVTLCDQTSPLHSQQARALAELLSE